MAPNDERLNSWKEIAAYLSKGVRTVIRWEKAEGLPVHRHQHESRASVFAYKSELDEWWKSRPSLDAAATEVHSEPGARHTYSAKWLLVAGSVLVAGAAVLLWPAKQKIAGGDRLQIEPLTAYEGRQSSPTFSPDGSYFAFSWNGVEGHQNIWVQTAGMAEPRRLTSLPAWELSPAWSPDGRWIAFIRRTDDFVSRIYMMPVNGGPERHLQDLSIPVFAEATELSWSPDSQWLVYPDSPAGQPGLHVIHVHSGERRRLTEGSHGREHLDPSLSPDGRTLAFRCRNEERISEICVVPVTSDWRPERKPEQITSLGMRSTSPVWSGDGKSIYFSAGKLLSSEASLYQVTVFPALARSNQPVRLTKAFGEEHYSLAMPPRARLPAFTRKRSDMNIYEGVYEQGRWRPSVKVNGLSSTRHDMDPDFSPDGRKIVFTSDRSGSMELWIANADGRNTRQLTEFGTRYVDRPRFSPDGRQVAFCEGDTSAGSVWLVSASGGSPTKLIRAAWYPTWSTDGQSIYYSNVEGLFRARAYGGGPPVAIAGPGSCCAWESSDGRFIFFARDGAVWKTGRSGGLEERVLAPSGAPAMMLRFVGRDEGIYTFHELVPHPPVGLYRFPGGPLAELFQVRERSGPGFAVSPDRRRILFAQEDGTQIDIAILRDER